MNKKNKKSNLKNKLLISSTLLSVFTLPIIATSCLSTSRDVIKNNQQQIQQTDIKEQQWTSFLQNKAIKSILDKVFINQQQRDEFINSQKNINDKAYLKEMANWRYYYSNLQPSSDSFFRNPKALIKAKDKYVELLSKNWLWYLFNLQKFTFIVKPDIDLFKETSEEAVDSLKRGVTKTDFFYKPKTNIIVDFINIYESNLNKSVEELEDDLEGEYVETNHYVLMSQEGFIFELELRIKYDNDKNVKDVLIELFGHIKTLPDLRELKGDLLKKFNLSKYARVSETKRDNSIISPIETDLFYELYGGRELVFVVIDNDLE